MTISMKAILNVEESFLLLVCLNHLAILSPKKKRKKEHSLDLCCLTVKPSNSNLQNVINLALILQVYFCKFIFHL